MANTFKLKTKTNVGVTTVGIYTAPSSTTTVGIGITRASSDDIHLMKNVPIPQGSSLEVMGGNKVVLETTDTITAKSDTAGSLDVALTIMEIT